MDIIEVWEIIPEYDEYAISNLGRVKRVKDSSATYGRARAGHILKQADNQNGYLSVTLCKNGRKKTFWPHQIVMSVFHGERPNGKCVHHHNGDRHDNRLSNLSYVTFSYNSKDGYLNGDIQRGEDRPNNKLKEGEVWLIKKLLAEKVMGKFIAKMFKISCGCVSQIKTCKSWTFVEA